MNDKVFDGFKMDLTVPEGIVRAVGGVIVQTPDGWKWQVRVNHGAGSKLSGFGDATGYDEAFTAIVETLRTSSPPSE